MRCLINLVNTVALHNGVRDWFKDWDHLFRQKECCYPVEMMFLSDNNWKIVDESDFRREVVLLLCKTEDHICSVCESINIKSMFSDWCKEGKFCCLKWYFFFSWVFCGIANTKNNPRSFPTTSVIAFCQFCYFFGCCGKWNEKWWEIRSNMLLMKQTLHDHELCFFFLNDLLC